MKLTDNKFTISFNKFTISLKQDTSIYKDITRLVKLKAKFVSLMNTGNIEYFCNQYCYSSHDDSEALYTKTRIDIVWIVKNERIAFNLMLKISKYITDRISKDYYSLFDITYDGQGLDIANNNYHYTFYFQSLEASILIDDFKTFLKNETRKLIFDN